MHQIGNGKARGLLPLALLLRRHADDDHAHRLDVRRQAEDVPLLVAALQNVADIARAVAQRVRRNHAALRRDRCIQHREQEVALARPAQRRVQLERAEQVEPALVVRAEHQHQRRLRDERLIVAGDGQPLLLLRVGHADRRPQRHVARRGRLHRRLEDRLHVLLRHLFGLIGAHALALHQLPDRLIHRFHPLRLSPAQSCPQGSAARSCARGRPRCASPRAP